MIKLFKFLFFIAILYGAYWLYTQVNVKINAQKDAAEFNKTHETVDFRR